MRIRNSHTGAEYSSSTLKKYNYIRCYIDDNYLFNMDDGWKEVKEDKWHDLRKNPDDIPKEAGLYFCKYYSNDLHDICDYDVMLYETHFKPCAHNDRTISGWSNRYGYPCSRNKDVIAWRELPKFEEE